MDEYEQVLNTGSPQWHFLLRVSSSQETNMVYLPIRITRLTKLYNYIVWTFPCRKRMLNVWSTPKLVGVPVFLGGACHNTLLTRMWPSLWSLRCLNQHQKKVHPKVRRASHPIVTFHNQPFHKQQNMQRTPHSQTKLFPWNFTKQHLYNKVNHVEKQLQGKQ